MIQDNQIEVFTDLLKKHDWYYSQSDSPSVWENGNAQAIKIKQLRDELDLTHDGIGTKLFNSFNPFLAALRINIGK
jgi:hypothetical protein